MRDPESEASMNLRIPGTSQLAKSHHALRTAFESLRAIGIKDFLIKPIFIKFPGEYGVTRDKTEFIKTALSSLRIIF